LRPELLIPLTRGGRDPIYLQVQQALRQAIRDRRLRPGTAVPSTRTLAADLGISRGVIVEAYDQLIAEGYLMATPGSTTRVTALVPVAAQPRVEPEPETFALDFRPGQPDLRCFPREAWQRASRHALGAIGVRHLAYGDQRGAAELRSALAEYLARTRGVAGSPDQLIICTGCAQGLSIAARVLLKQGVRRIALEDPGHPGIRRLINEAGLATIPVPVDDDGLDVDALERTRVQAVLVSPAHQNPLGSVLTPFRRQQLLAWAARRSGVIVEDDYDSEYRYDRTAIGALQGLAPERIIYVGSASKILAPGLRLGWMVIGGPLLERAVEVKRHLDNGSPILEQLTYAHFVRSGELDRHVRRTRRSYRSRRDALLQALSRHYPDWGVRGAAAGLHLVVQPPLRSPIARIVDRAAAASVRVYPLSDYAWRTTGRHGLVLGYAGLTEAEIAEAIRRIRHGLS